MVSDGAMDEYTKYQMQKAGNLGLRVSWHQVMLNPTPKP